MVKIIVPPCKISPPPPDRGGTSREVVLPSHRIAPNEPKNREEVPPLMERG